MWKDSEIVLSVHSSPNNCICNATYIVERLVWTDIYIKPKMNVNSI